MDELQDAINAIAKGDKEKARSLLYAILKEDRNNESAWLLMSQVIDDQQKKLECINRALSINPRSGAAYDSLCLLYYRMGQYQKGLENGKKAVELIEHSTPLKPQAIRYNNLSLCLFALGKTEEAIQYAQKASSLDPHNLQVQENLKLYTKKLGKKRRNTLIWSIIVFSAVIFLICRVLISLSSKQTPTPPTYNTPRPTLKPTEQVIYAIDYVELVKDSLECEHDSIGNMIMTGKVTNNGPYQLTLVKIRGTTYTSANGKQLNTNYSYIASDVLNPGAISTFTVYVDDPENEATYCKVTIEDAYFSK
ncbi:MAG: tetratricopeptide repeat protein [Anaerolineae bacterium]|nr:tetratricopeptide repeat protein [Anaerolineae bacterium]